MTKEHNKHPERIIQDPDILVGKPVIKGTRIPMELVRAKLAANSDRTEFFQDYPQLTVDDVKACLSCAQVLVAKQQKATKHTHPPV